MAHRNRVFISYSHRDIKYLQRLQVHLAQYAGEGLADYWDDTKIQTGVEWEREIFQAIDSARIAILLVSADFLASSYIMRKEVPRLLTAARDEGLVVVPVIISPCAFAESVLAPYQVVNGPRNTLSGMDHAKREGIWARVAELVARTLRDTHAEASSSAGKQETAKPAEAGAKTTGILSGPAGSKNAPVERVHTSQTIIVADDDVAIADSFTQLLESEFPTYSVLQAEDGRHVLKLVEREAPALLIMDVFMPFMDGFTALEKLASRAVPFPIILMSGDRWVQDRLFSEIEKLTPNLIPGQVRTLYKPRADIDTVLSLVRELLPESE